MFNGEMAATPCSAIIIRITAYVHTNSSKSLHDISASIIRWRPMKHLVWTISKIITD